jgi:hypothetical protein
MEDETMFSLFHRKFPDSDADWYTKIDTFSLTSLSRGHSVSFKTSGHNALLFSYQSSTWLWTTSGTTHLETEDTTNTSSKLSVFSVEVVARDIWIVDTFIYNNRGIISRDYLERMEVARRWMQHQPLRQRTLPTRMNVIPFKSAYPDYEILMNDMTIRCKQLFPGHEANEIWKQKQILPFPSDGLVFNCLLCPREPGLLWYPQ